jgi:hypothetical protein
MALYFKIPNILPAPWHWDNTDFVPQLQKEISPKHLLFGKSLISKARRQDNSDILFELVEGEFKYAVVHLTWSQEQEEDAQWPSIYLYKTWADVYVNRILPDSEDFEE